MIPGSCPSGVARASQIARSAVSGLAWLSLAVACGGQALIGSVDDEPATPGPVSDGGAGSASGIAKPVDSGAVILAGGSPPSMGGAAAGGASPDGSVQPEGEAGAPPVAGSDACQSATWIATATVMCAPDGEVCAGWPTNPQNPAQAIDCDFNTRYTTGRAQAGTEEFVVTFPALVEISGLRMIIPNLFHSSVVDSPAAYAVEYSTDGVAFQPFDPARTGSGEVGLTPVDPRGLELPIPFPPTIMKAVKVKQTGKKALWWSILELAVNDCRPQ